ncbi:putative phage tail assembly chaperone [Pseudodesulfovibrio sp.]|uniref:putative phage tail assembly chaperone n=1 Tax=unclassified Pseudodesulfovibrio TaxID=2661612 RepID=UPI003B0087CE
MDKTIVLTIKDKDITFTVGVDEYNRFVNEMQPKNKVAPAHNFLMRTVDDASKDDLRALLALPGASLDIVGSLVEEYVPDLNIMVGKSSA